MLIILEVTQYRARPLGNDKLKKANINGIIHSISWLCVCCLGSVLTGVTIFCCTHIVLPTRRGNMYNLSGEAKSNHKKLLFRGSMEYTIGHE
jgi:hypothetical protein